MEEFPVENITIYVRNMPVAHRAFRQFGLGIEYQRHDADPERFLQPRQHLNGCSDILVCFVGIIGDDIDPDIHDPGPVFMKNSHALEELFPGNVPLVNLPRNAFAAGFQTDMNADHSGFRQQPDPGFCDCGWVCPAEKREIHGFQVEIAE